MTENVSISEVSGQYIDYKFDKTSINISSRSDSSSNQIMLSLNNIKEANFIGKLQ